MTIVVSYSIQKAYFSPLSPFFTAFNQNSWSKIKAHRNLVITQLSRHDIRSNRLIFCSILYNNNNNTQSDHIKKETSNRECLDWTWLNLTLIILFLRAFHVVESWTGLKIATYNKSIYILVSCFALCGILGSKLCPCFFNFFCIPCDF